MPNVRGKRAVRHVVFDTNFWKSFVHARLAVAMVVGQVIAEEPATATPFDGHGVQFIRAALHLRHRADAAGVLVPLFYYCAGSHYRLSHPSRYREALGDEPARLAETSFKQILASP